MTGIQGNKEVEMIEKVSIFSLNEGSDENNQSPITDIQGIEKWGL